MLFERRGSQSVISALLASYCAIRQQDILEKLGLLLQVYRRQIYQLHKQFALKRELASDLYSVDVVLGWCQQNIYEEPLLRGEHPARES